uniref:Uncharacterized protein n=1 Tax=Anguilla anguilla TaxID=7936 RepID=A0A0E9UWR7_ANGAN
MRRRGRPWPRGSPTSG